jgi:hypothetical protein
LDRLRAAFAVGLSPAIGTIACGALLAFQLAGIFKVPSPAALTVFATRSASLVRVLIAHGTIKA